MNTNIASQLRLAADIIETGHPWKAKVRSDQWLLNMENDSPLTAIAHNREIRLVLATPPDGRPLHNPHGLDAEKVGAGYRLTAVGDPFDHTAEKWFLGEWEPTWNAASYSPNVTYRVPLSTPWPDAEKRVKPWSLPPPPAGRQWHRDDWTEDKLEPGERPYLSDEILVLDDPLIYKGGDKSTVMGLAGVSASDVPDVWFKTRRPLPVEEWVNLEPGDVPPGSAPSGKN